MIVIKRILIVAPDRGLRRSLEFALEAEGFTVDSHARLAAAVASRLAPTTVCAVIDGDAILDRVSDWDALARLSKAIVLLVDRPEGVPYLAGMRVLVKPLLGNALIETVQRMVVRRVAKS